MIEIESVSKLYGGAAVVDDVSMTIESGTITVIVGTSGSGKTTLMRMINRLIEPTHGRIRIDGEDTSLMPGHELRRRIGYVIQGNGLFPHRTVAQNIATVPRLIGWSKARTSDKVDELLRLFQLEPKVFANRYPHELSGGQQQRVGVARALAAEPRVLLMDEPFGALDPVIRAKAQDDLLDVQKLLGTTVVLVTHDMDEAFRLASRIAVMDRGKIVQHGAPEDLIRAPSTPFVEAMAGGSERSLRLLSLGRAGDAAEPGEASGDPIRDDASQQAALADMLWTGREALPVVSADGSPKGRITLKALLQRAARR